MVQTDALSAARALEQRLEGFYPDEPFEERLGRLKTLSIDQAEKYGIKDWITRYQKTPFSEESIKIMAAALAGRPTMSKTIGIPTAGKAGDSWTKILYWGPGEPQLAAEAGLWSSDLAKAANQFVRDTLTKINDSLYIADVKDAQFARGILRDEVFKTQAAYTSKALDHKAGLGTPEKVMSKETPLGTQIGLPSLSAKARVFLG
ncbi:hypothetical protein FRC09_015224 [Ceratobasidium sp. 395]|nr:hypothetical protein FRC09_015224 [Ceratobasidium sp. 395]